MAAKKCNGCSFVRCGVLYVGPSRKPHIFDVQYLGLCWSAYFGGLEL